MAPFIEGKARELDFIFISVKHLRLRLAPTVASPRHQNLYFQNLFAGTVERAVI